MCLLGHRSHFSPAGLQLHLLEEGLIVLRAVGVAGAGPNGHDRLLDDLPWGALKLHLDGFGVVRGTAPAIAADPTEPGFVGVQARAILELQVDGLRGLLGAETLFTFLRKRKRRTLNGNPAVLKDRVSRHPSQPVLFVNKSLTLFG